MDQTVYAVVRRKELSPSTGGLGFVVVRGVLIPEESNFEEWTIRLEGSGQMVRLGDAFRSLDRDDVQAKADRLNGSMSGALPASGSAA